MNAGGLCDDYILNGTVTLQAIRKVAVYSPKPKSTQ